MLKDLAPIHWRIAARTAVLTLLGQAMIPMGAVAQQAPSEPRPNRPLSM